MQVIKQTKMVGASNWLNAIPLAEHVFILSKGEFRDALALVNVPVVKDLILHVQ